MQDAVRNRNAVHFLMIKLENSSESRVFKRIKRQTDSKERLHVSSKGALQLRTAVPCLEKADLGLMAFTSFKHTDQHLGE